jgi:serine/threonine protein kinase
MTMRCFIGAVYLRYLVPMSLSPGSRLGPYEIIAPLGAGGMGEVYRAKDVRLGRDVAIKALPAAFAREPDRLERFRREAQALASVNHPNIATIYALEDVEGAMHLVLELVDGEPLSAIVARGPMELRDALPIALQIAAAIEAAHERGIVHRDLKPGNVMVQASGVVKVLDFGLAKLDPSLPSGSDPAKTPTITHAGGTEAGAVLGTAAYMSPEQARGRAVDRRSDVWSFGCVLFELLAGRPPFAGATVPDLLAKILEREPDWAALPDTVPARVRTVLRRCLRKDADERPRDIRDVRLELAEAAGASRGDAAREKSIAVLPFENQSGADDEYFADGVTEEILNALAHLEGLRVAGRTSCFAFKGRREDLRAIGEKLDVATILEGTIRRSGPRLRITARLVGASDGYQLWSERYDREMTDVFEVQDEIAGAIAARLRVSLQADTDRRAHRGTKSLEAYELLLKGRALQLKRGRFLWRAIECFERAIALDPGYAEPLAWLADSYRLLGTFSLAPSKEVMTKAKELAERALAIDPDLAEANATLADIASQYEFGCGPALARWDRALAADPRHIRSRCERAVWAFAYDAISPDRALAELDVAVAQDPLNAWALGMKSMLLAFLGRHRDSVVESERALAADPDSFFAQWNTLRSYAFAGDTARAIETAPALLAATGRNTWPLATLGWTYGKIGDAAKSRAVYDELAARARHEFVGPFWLAVAAAAAGLMDDAMRLVERAVAERDPFVVLSRKLPLCDAIRADSRFEGIVRGVWG